MTVPSPCSEQNFKAIGQLKISYGQTRFRSIWMRFGRDLLYCSSTCNLNKCFMFGSFYPPLLQKQIDYQFHRKWCRTLCFPQSRHGILRQKSTNEGYWLTSPLTVGMWCNIGYPSETHIKLKSREISFVHNIRFCWQYHCRLRWRTSYIAQSPRLSLLI